MAAVRMMTWIARIVGVSTLLLGLTFWVTNINSAPIHMLFGITFALSFLLLSIIMQFTQGMRLLGTVGIIYALILPVFGITQVNLLLGDWHWLIQVAHLLVGLGALTLIQITSLRYQRLKQPVSEYAISRKNITQAER
jgi:hypothetical protein